MIRFHYDDDGDDDDEEDPETSMFQLFSSLRVSDFCKFSDCLCMCSIHVLHVQSSEREE